MNTKKKIDMIYVRNANTKAKTLHYSVSLSLKELNNVTFASVVSN